MSTTSVRSGDIVADETGKNYIVKDVSIEDDSPVLTVSEINEKSSRVSFDEVKLADDSEKNRRAKYVVIKKQESNSSVYTQKQVEDIVNKAVQSAVAKVMQNLKIQADDREGSK